MDSKEENLATKLFGGLGSILGSIVKEGSVGGNEEKSNTVWICDICNEGIAAGEFRYNCTKCRLELGSFDFCERCYQLDLNKLKHKNGRHEPMAKEFVYTHSITSEAFLDYNSLTNTLLNAVKNFHNRRSMGVRKYETISENGKEVRRLSREYHWLTYEQVGNKMKRLSWGLKKLITPKSCIGMCSENRPEWMISNFACILQGFVTVPIHTTFDIPATKSILINTKMACVICSRQFLDKFIEVSKDMENMQLLICMDELNKEELEKFTKQINSTRTTQLITLPLKTMSEVENLGNLNPSEFITMGPDEIFSINHTSGSTGIPKGVMFKARSYYNDTIHAYNQIFHVNFSFQPHAHTDSINQIRAFINGTQIGFFSGDMNNIIDDIQVLRPTSLSAIPRFWNMLYSEYKQILNRALENSPLDTHEAVKAKVLQKFSKTLGNRIGSLHTGSAPIAPFVLQWMKECFKQYYVTQGYGTTESGSVSSGTSIYSDVIVKLVDVPEMGYYYPQGEICVKTPVMTCGYLNNEEETNTSFDEEGYFRTGDIGEISNGVLTIIDRKKNLFKLTQGEYVSPEKIEAVILESKFIDQVFVHGDSYQTYPVAIIIPNMEILSNWLVSNVPDFVFTDKQAIVSNPQVKKKLMTEIVILCKNAQLLSYEIPRAIHVDYEQFTSENGLMTPSLKLCRFMLIKHYRNDIDNMYQIMEESSVVLSLTPTEDKLKEMMESLMQLKLPSNSSFVDIGGDSLTAVRLVEKIKLELKVDIPVQDVLDRNRSTISNIAKMIDKSDKPEDKMLIDFDRETMINPIIKNRLSRSAKSKDISEQGLTIFLTGCTGFLGTFLLKEILQQLPAAIVICLVRSKDNEDAEIRALKSIEYYELPITSLERSRITFISGDCSLPNFGLQKNYYEALSKEVDIIYHCAAKVNSILTYSSLKKDNVHSTREIIYFSTYQKLKPIHYISTTSVLSHSHSDDHNYLSHDICTLERLSGYTQSKWVAEVMMDTVSEWGVPICIYRPGRISGSTVTGASNPSDLVVKIIAGLAHLRKWPCTENASFEMTPVDYVSKTIVSLSKKKLFSKTFNITNFNENGGAISLETIIRAISSYGFEMEGVNQYNDWYNFLVSNSNGNPLESLVHSHFQNYFPESFASKIKCKNLLAECDDKNCPVLDFNLIKLYINWLLKRNLIK